MNGTAKTMARWLLTVAVVLTVGFATVQGVDARKVTVKAAASVKDRVQAQRDLCELIGGGTLEVTSTPIITFTTCKGGTEGGTHCTHTNDETSCTTPSRTQPAQDGRAGITDVTDAAIEEPPPAAGATVASGATIVAIDDDQP